MYNLKQGKGIQHQVGSYYNLCFLYSNKCILIPLWTVKTFVRIPWTLYDIRKKFIMTTLMNYLHMTIVIIYNIK